MNTAKMTIEQQHSVSGEDSQEVTPFEVLKVKVYPVINNVILKLIDQIVKSHEVEKHEQRLQKKKLLDQLQKKYIEREIQKQELGSDYQQSDDQEYYKKLSMNKERVESIIHKRLEKNKQKNLFEERQEDNQIEEFGENVFNPIQFIIDELKRYQKLKAEGRLDEFEPKQEKKSTNKNMQ